MAGMTSSKFFMFLRDFVQEYHPAKLGLQINEKHGRGIFYFLHYILPEQPSLNRVKDGKISHKPGNLLHSKSVDSAKVLRSLVCRQPG